MKRFSLIVLSVLLIFCLCSCDSPHRKIVFSDGTEICFYGDCNIHDTFISYQVGGTVISQYSYVSIDDRSFQIVKCSCDVLED